MPDIQLLKNEITKSVGQKMRSFSVSSAPVAGILSFVKSHLLELRDAGLLSPISTKDPDRNLAIEAWNEFVSGKPLSSYLDQPITMTIVRYMELLTQEISNVKDDGSDPYQMVLTERMVDPLATVLAKEISSGFSTVAEHKDHLWGRYPSSWDRHLGEMCLVTFSGWNPEFWKEEGEDGVFVRLDLLETEPSLVHFTIPAHEPIWFVGSTSAPQVIRDALYEAQVNKIGLPERFNGNVGKLAHSRDTQAALGVMSMYMGDHFPRLVREPETGKAYLVSFGQTNAADEADELKAECPEDWENGFFLIEDPRFDMSNETIIERFSIATQTDLLNLVSAESGENAEAILKLMEKDLASPYPNLVRLDPFPSEVHVYAAYGAAVEMSHKTFVDAGHYPFIGGRECSMIISPAPLRFPEGVVEELGVESPRQRAERTDVNPSF